MPNKIAVNRGPSGGKKLSVAVECSDDPNVDPCYGSAWHEGPRKVFKSQKPVKKVLERSKIIKMDCDSPGGS